MTNTVVRVGAVAAGPSVATIWEGMRAYFEDAGVPIVPMLFCIRGAEPSVDQSRCGLEGQELPRRGLYVSFARRNRPRELPDGRSPHQSGDPPYDPKERGNRRVRPVASDSERARLAEVDHKSADEVNPDQHALAAADLSRDLLIGAR